MNYHRMSAHTEENVYYVTKNYIRSSGLSLGAGFWRNWRSSRDGVVALLEPLIRGPGGNGGCRPSVKSPRCDRVSQVI